MQAASVQEGAAQSQSSVQDRKLLNLAVVTETFPPEVNGVSRTIARVVEELARRGHNLMVIRPRQDALPEKPPTGRVQELLVRSFPLPRYPDLKIGAPAFNQLVRTWSSMRPDLVHIVTEGPLGLAALMAASKLRIPVCSEFRTNFHTYCGHYGAGLLRRPVLAYLRWFHNRTQRTMVPTRALSSELETLGFKNLKVVPRGVDTHLFNPNKRSESLRATWGAHPDTIVVIHVGRLAWEKNLPVVLACFEAIHRARPNSRLVFVGDGPARLELERRCPVAIFAGTQKGANLAAHYASGDLFVFPSLTETFGNVTTEAMASGLPVLAYDCAAAGELIQSGSNGTLARVADETQIVGHAVHLALNDRMMTAQGQNARATANTLGWDRIVDQIESVYANCMEQFPAV